MFGVDVWLFELHRQNRISFCLKTFQTSLSGYVFLLFRARRSRHLAEHSALRGMGFMGLFVYKYIADTCFVMISCVDAGGFVS